MKAKPHIIKRSLFNLNRLHIVLLLLNSISLFFILQIVFNLFPLFASNLPVEKINNINSFIADISICIITSSFFYYLLVYIPEKQRKNNVLNIFNNQLSSISSSLFYILFFTYAYSKKEHLISIDDFRKEETWNSLIIEQINPKLIKEITPITEELKEKINNIFNNTLATYLDDKILYGLSSASNSIFITKITLCNLEPKYLAQLELNGIMDIFNLYKQLSNTKEIESENGLLKLLMKPA